MHYVFPVQELSASDHLDGHEHNLLGVQGLYTYTHRNTYRREKTHGAFATSDTLYKFPKTYVTIIGN